ncbi:LOW QUALITY PROTEIN: breast cancer anti-estrogen resistance protein 1-like [Amphiura filiformis]|uniref:LOW QUALITY PROTEIN: breast cancer anti-estrogen resistance protein 1-like n=1 Tax=Amphiura filiformis TaxID=82378 RepID=UPI003B2277D9
MAGFTKHVLAKALYDNNAEAPDELAFRKGDVVTVLEQNTSGLEGWWLCSLNGRQGIAPGNRLKLLVGMYDSSPSPQKVNSPTGHGPVLMYDSPLSPGGRRTSAPGASMTEDYDIPRPSPHARVSSPEVSLGYQTIPGARKPPAFKLQHQNSEEVYDVPPKQYSTSPQETYDVPVKQYSTSPQETYDVPKTTHWASPVKSHSAHTSPTHSIEPTSPTSLEFYDTPTKQGFMAGDVYDVPPSAHGIVLPMKKSAIEKDLSDDYDIPVPSVESQIPVDTYDVPQSLGKLSPTETYDVPPSLNREIYDSPRKPGGTLDGPRIPEGAFKDMYNSPTKGGLGDDYGSPGYCKMKALSHGNVRADFDHVYDIPPQVTKDRPLTGSLPILTKSTSVEEVDAKMQTLNVNTEQQRSKSFDMGTLGRKVLLDRDTAMDLLVKRQQVLETAIAYMLSYVSSVWRHQADLEPKIHEIKAACNQLKLALKEFLEFAKDTVTYAAKSDANLQIELGISLQPLQASHAKLLRSALTLDNLNWSVDKLKYTPTSSDNAPSDLDQFANVAKVLPSDMKKFIAFVTTNCDVLFKRLDQRSQSLGLQTRPLPTPPGGVSALSPEKSFDWMAPEKEDSATTNMTSPEVQRRPLPHVPGQISFPITNNANSPTSDDDDKGGDYGYITKTSDITRQIIVTTETNHNITYTSELTANDREIIKFYQQEVQSISEDTISAVDKFFTCVEAKQPPKVFVAHSKHVILLGHKLVFIGDTLHHNLSHTQFRSRVIHMSDLLCDCLNVGVNSTKTAALQYPAVQPIQEMVDRLTDIANATQDLKLAILEVTFND